MGDPTQYLVTPAGRQDSDLVIVCVSGAHIYPRIPETKGTVLV
ncbi:hypothetical protein ACVH9Z_28490 [Rhodococcus opacus]|nr:hypothetical protein [Rhodococcus opacus]MDJ0420238.1 hypothetical protein [Rhodococcus opacus]MDV7090099.1 hypothetical protein [Rhodococcus opacus]WKN52640.1 hypothetical protein HJ581_0001620 [Rhodococcus opacus]